MFMLPVALFICLGFSAVVHWTIYIFTQCFTVPNFRLTYSIVNVILFGIQLGMGYFIASTPFLSENWASMLAGSILYKIGYLSMHASEIQSYKYKVWLADQVYNLILSIIWISLFEYNVISIANTQPQWIYYWHGVAITFYIQEAVQVYWQNFYMRLSFFLLQRILRTCFIVLAAMHLWINPYLLGWGLAPALITEAGCIYFEIKALYKIWSAYKSKVLADVIVC